MKSKNISAVIRSVLLVSAVGIALKLGDTEIEKGVDKSSEWLTDKTGIFYEYWHWILAGGLLFAGFFLKLLTDWLRSGWYWISQRFYAPFVFLCTVTALVFVDLRNPSSVYFFGVCLFLVLASVLWCFWPQGHSDEAPVDCLHRGYFVDQLAEIFLSDKARLRRVAILGTWGAGKTTILELLWEKLRKSKNAKFRIAFVNPWKARTPEEAWAILAKGFDQALGLPSPLSRKWASHPTLTGLLRLLPLPGIGDDLISIFEGSGGVADQRRVEKINSLLKNRKTKVVLLVDDMERAEPEVIRKMFPVIDKLCELKNCFFVFAIDRNRVAKAFQNDTKVAEETFGYLDKVFDLQLELPDPLTEDIGEMCEMLLDTELCPRLANHFPKLKAFLPTNPRAARKFLNLAETKEVLFLNRYREDEHPYLPFFVLWMLESELPGSIEALLRPDIEKHFEAIVGFTLFDNKTNEIESDNFKKIKGALVAKHSTADEQRIHILLEALVKQSVNANGRVWLEKKGFSFRWAAYGHLRLLELSITERAELEKQWNQHAGIESIQEMLDEALPDKPFSSIKTCATQLIEMEAEKIEYAVRECYRTKNQELIQETISGALAATKRLRSHFAYAVDRKLEIELEVFGENLFRTWLENINRNPLEPLTVPAAADLRTERFEFSYDFIAMFPVERCFQLYMGGVARIVDPPRDGSHTETQEYVKELRRRLLERVTNHVFTLFRKGSMPDDWYENSVTKQGGIEFLYTPGHWLPVEFTNGDLGALGGLVEESESSSSVANSFAKLVEELFMEPLSRGIDPDRIGERRNILHLIGHKQDNYIRLLWKGAQSGLVDAELRDQLLKQRELAIKQGCGKNEPPDGHQERALFIWDSQIEELFPVDETEHLNSSGVEGGKA